MRAPADGPASGVRASSSGPAARLSPNIRAAHPASCVSPTAPIPSTFPIISSNGRTDEAITSTIRLAFSSITPRITSIP